MEKRSLARKIVEAAVVAGTIAGAGAKEAEKGISGIEQQYADILKEVDGLKEKHFEYHLADKEITSITRLARAVEKMQVDRTDLFRSREAPSTVTAKLLTMRQSLWSEMKTAFPSLPTEYSDRIFFRASARLPEMLAPHGVFTDHLVRATRTGRGELVDISVNFGPFFPVISKEQTHQSFFGKKFDADVLTLGHALTGESRPTHVGEGTYAITVFGNVFVYGNTGESLQNVIQGNKVSIRRKIQEFKNSGLDTQFTNLPARERSDYVIFMALHHVFETAPDQPSDVLAKHVRNHELGHALDNQDPHFMNAFKIPESELLNPYSTYPIHQTSHAEVDGLLSELRYGSKDAALITLLLNLSSAAQQEAAPHHFAAHWIWRELSEKMRRDPVAFGISISDSSPYTENEQILLGFPDAVRKNQGVYHKLFEEIWTIHRSRLSEDIFTPTVEDSVSREAPPVLPQPEPKGRMPITELLVAGTGAAVAFIAGLRVKQLRERLQAERAIRKAKIDAIKQALQRADNKEQLLNDLQFEANPKEIDRHRQQSAYDAIEEIARKSSRVRKMLPQIREIIGKKD